MTHLGKRKQPTHILKYLNHNAEASVLTETLNTGEKPPSKIDQIPED